MYSPIASQRVAHRFATQADIDQYYGTQPYPTMRAVVLTLNDRPAAVLGVARHESYAQFFSEYRPEYRPYLRSIVTLRAIKQVMSMVSQSTLPVYAMAEEEEPDSVRILTRLGFVAFEGNLFRWPH
jgi:hypothetical protein